MTQSISNSSRGPIRIRGRVFLSALLLLGVSTSLSSLAPEEPVPHLKLDEKIEGQLGPDRPEVYGVELGAGTFLLGRVDQQSVDAAVRILGPGGERLDVFDATERGAERFQVVTEEAGLYRVQLEALGEEIGGFSIALERLEPAADTPEGMADQHFARWDRDDVPGVAVGVVDGGELIFSRAYGMANLTHGVPFTPERRSNIGSISKQFTAMAVLLLAQEGKLSLDDPLRQYTPRLPAVSADVTIRHVLHHTSGLREIFNTLSLSGWEAEDSLSREEVYGMVEDQEKLQFEPGSEHLYNNTGYLLLADLVETITEEPFDLWMQTHVFAPLAMKSTVVRMRRGQVLSGSVQGYLPDEQAGGFREGGDIEQSRGAGGIYSTVADLALWMRNFRDGTLGGRELVEMMTTPGVLNDGEVTDYGFGVVIDELRGLRRVWHNGGDLAHTSMLAYLPELDAGVILLANQPGFSGMGNADRLFEVFFADRLPAVEAGASGTDAEEAREADAEEAEALELPVEVLQRYAGKWELESVGIVVQILRRDTALLIQIPGRPELALSPISATELGIEGRDARLEFHLEGEGPVQRATWHQMGELGMRRVAEWKPAATELEVFVGRYLSSELEAFWTVELENGDLLARQYRRENPVGLQPKEEDSFSGQPPLLEVRFARDEEGDISGFFASFGRTRDVWFQRFPAIGSP